MPKAVVSAVRHTNSLCTYLHMYLQQKTMQSQEQRQQVKAITMQALNRLEELKLESSSQPKLAPSTSTCSTVRTKEASLLSELDLLPPPPKDSPKGASNRASTMPKGIYNTYVHTYIHVHLHYAYAILLMSYLLHQYGHNYNIAFYNYVYV